MSIQTYNQGIFFDDRLTDGTAVVEDLTTKNGMAMEFEVRILTTQGHDKRVTKSTTFTIVGSSESAISDSDMPQAFLGLIEAGSRMASNIAYLSKGVISGFFAKLGKYRPDEVPIDVPTGDTSYGSIYLTNNENDEYGKDSCSRSTEFPAVVSKSKLYIPWLRDDISRQDMIQTLSGWSYTNNGIMYELGNVKFKDDKKIDMVAIPTAICTDVKVAGHSRPTPILLQNNDNDLGILSDKVASEDMNDFNEGVDDPS